MQAYSRILYETNKKIICGLPGNRFIKLLELMWYYRNKALLMAHQRPAQHIPVFPGSPTKVSVAAIVAIPIHMGLLRFMCA
jgi:hypothetical protein